MDPQTPSAILSVRPYLRLRRAADAIAFYTRAFGAVEVFRLTEPSGRIGHAELHIGPTTIFLADEYPEFGIRGPESLGGATIALHLDVEDVDALTQRATEAGATLLRPPGDEFHGQRASVVRDPFGHEWMFAQTIEELSHEDMQRRFSALFQRT